MVNLKMTHSIDTALSELDKTRKLVLEAARTTALRILSEYEVGKQVAYWTCVDDEEIHSRDYTRKSPEEAAKSLSKERGVKVSALVRTQEVTGSSSLEVFMELHTSNSAYEVHAPLVQTPRGTGILLEELCVQKCP